MSLFSTLLLSGAIVAAAYPMPAAAQSLAAPDLAFIDEAAKGGMKEVHMGHMGLQKGMSEGVKGFSQRLVNDHTKANKELAALAMKKGTSLPADIADAASSMPISKKSGADFDREFAKEMVTDHEKAIALFEKQASSGTDAELKKWAADTLPTLRAHLKEAQALPRS